jgi:hypothetical protein
MCYEKVSYDFIKINLIKLKFKEKFLHNENAS